MVSDQQFIGVGERILADVTSAARVRYYVRNVEVGGSNPLTSTMEYRCGGDRPDHRGDESRVGPEDHGEDHDTACEAG